MTAPYDLAIVGAGICGLTAAIDLRERNPDARILILEAGDEPGGRARGMALDNGAWVNAGAAWFHGGDDNPFYHWARARYELGEATLDHEDRRLTRWEGKENSGQALQDAFDRMDQAYELFHRENPGKDISLYDLTRQTGDAELVKVAHYRSTEWMALDSARNISCYEYFNDPLGPGGWILKDGTGRLIDAMAREAREGETKIECGCAVTGIRERDGVVRVTAGNGREWTARRALVTASAGVLQSGSLTFDAPVRAAVRKATRGLKMGNLIKVMVPVSESFMEERGIAVNMEAFLVDQEYFIHARTAGRPLITIFKGGTVSHRMEGWAQDKLERLATDVLGSIGIFRGFETSRTGEIAITGWFSNPFTRGSYSVSAPHFRRSDPFSCGLVYFAGEAFIADPRKSPGQMAGAWRAGRMAAEQIASGQ